MVLIGVPLFALFLARMVEIAYGRARWEVGGGEAWGGRRGAGGRLRGLVVVLGVTSFFYLAFYRLSGRGFH